MTTEAELIDLLDAHRNRPVPGSGLARMIGGAIPESLRPLARVMATRLISPTQRRKAAKLSRARPVQLNVGCGSLPLPGWINVDLVGLPIDLAWDLSRTLPFDEGSVDAVFHEHVIEHLPASAGYKLLKECHRVLRPGGVLRVVAPDASKYIKSYLDPEHAFISGFRGDRPTPMMALQEEFYGFGHKAVYDHETIALFLRTIGFTTVEERAFGDSRLDPCPDSECRTSDSFYTEASK
jgi:predicted SAM-dependent methyltransferase